MAHLIAPVTMFLCVLLMVSCPLSTAEEGYNIGQQWADDLQRLKQSLNEQKEKYGEIRNFEMPKSEDELAAEEAMQVYNSMRDPKLNDLLSSLDEQNRQQAEIDKAIADAQNIHVDLDKVVDDFNKQNEASGEAGVPTGLFWLVVLSALYLLQAARLRA